MNRREGANAVTSDLETFEACRATLEALAYRMLGDAGARRRHGAGGVAALAGRARSRSTRPGRTWLKIVTRLLLERARLGAPRGGASHSRSGWLPEPESILRASALGPHGGRATQISMAFLVALERLTPAERAVLLLHDVFDFSHAERSRR